MSHSIPPFHTRTGFDAGGVGGGHAPRPATARGPQIGGGGDHTVAHQVSLAASVGIVARANRHAPPPDKIRADGQTRIDQIWGGQKRWYHLFFTPERIKKALTKIEEKTNKLLSTYHARVIASLTDSIRTTAVSWRSDAPTLLAHAARADAQRPWYQRMFGHSKEYNDFARDLSALVYKGRAFANMAGQAGAGVGTPGTRAQQPAAQPRVPNVMAAVAGTMKKINADPLAQELMRKFVGDATHPRAALAPSGQGTADTSWRSARLDNVLIDRIVGLDQQRLAGGRLSSAPGAIHIAIDGLLKGQRSSSLHMAEADRLITAAEGLRGLPRDQQEVVETLRRTYNDTIQEKLSLLARRADSGLVFDGRGPGGMQIIDAKNRLREAANALSRNAHADVTEDMLVAEKELRQAERLVDGGTITGASARAVAELRGYMTQVNSVRLPIDVQARDAYDRHSALGGGVESIARDLRDAATERGRESDANAQKRMEHIARAFDNAEQARLGGNLSAEQIRAFNELNHIYQRLRLSAPADGDQA